MFDLPELLSQPRLRRAKFLSGLSKGAGSREYIQERQVFKVHDSESI